MDDCGSPPRHHLTPSPGGAAPLQVINEVKDWLKSQGAEIAVLPKIESANSVMNLDEILEASGAITP